MLTDDEIDAIARKARRVFGVSIDEANRVFARAVVSAVLERLEPVAWRWKGPISWHLSPVPVSWPAEPLYVKPRSTVAQEG